MALKDDGFTGYEYVVFGEYSAGVIETITKQTGYYGEIYRYCYCAEQMALEKDTPGNPKGTTGGGSQQPRAIFGNAVLQRYAKNIVIQCTP